MLLYDSFTIALRYSVKLPLNQFARVDKMVWLDQLYFVLGAVIKSAQCINLHVLKMFTIGIINK